MMMLLSLLLLVVSLATLAAFIWLVTVAFRKSAFWGAMVLLLSPFSAIFFALKHWPDAKRPFLAYAGGTACFFVGLFLAFGYVGLQLFGMADTMSAELDAQFAQARMQTEEPSTAHSPAQPRDGGVAPATPASYAPAPTHPATTPSPGVAARLSVLESPSEPAPEIVRRGVASVPLRHAGEHLGEQVVVVSRDGSRQRGVLAAADARRLLLEVYLGGGTASFEIPARDVGSLEVRVR